MTSQVLDRFALRWNAGYRASTIARSSKSLVAVYDGIEAGFDVQSYLGDGSILRWTTVCETHGTICQHRTLAIARSFLPCPEAWCGACQKIVNAKGVYGCQ